MILPKYTADQLKSLKVQPIYNETPAYSNVQVQTDSPPSLLNDFYMKISQWFKWNGQRDFVDLSNTQASSDYSITEQSRKIKKICIVGVHGWFPRTKLMQTVFGEPMGTSEKLCDLTAEAVTLNDALKDCEVYKIPLNSHGLTVGDRAVTSLDLILNNSEHMIELKSADMIFMVGHSQGSIVAIMLMQLLLDQNLINCMEQNISIMSIAGILHGPYLNLKQNLVIQYVETEAARELFEFCDSTFYLSSNEDNNSNEFDDSILQKYVNSVKHILTCNVKLFCYASWQDEVVPLYSSLMWAFDHPNIYRFIYIGQKHQYSSHLQNISKGALNGDKVDFSIELMSYLTDLRNRNMPEFNLLPQIVISNQEVFQGNLLTGVNHSLIYGDLSVYQDLVGTTISLHSMAEQLQINPFYQSRSQQSSEQQIQYPNAYLIPYLMRQLFDTYASEPAKLQKLAIGYQNWIPNKSDRPARDLKRRLIAFELILQQTKSKL